MDVVVAANAVVVGDRDELAPWLGRVSDKTPYIDVFASESKLAAEEEVAGYELVKLMIGR